MKVCGTVQNSHSYTLYIVDFHKFTRPTTASFFSCWAREISLEQWPKPWWNLPHTGDEIPHKYVYRYICGIWKPWNKDTVINQSGWVMMSCQRVWTVGCPWVPHHFWPQVGLERPWFALFQALFRDFWKLFIYALRSLNSEEPVDQFLMVVSIGWLQHIISKLLEITIYPFKTGCLEFQVVLQIPCEAQCFVYPKPTRRKFTKAELWKDYYLILTILGFWTASHLVGKYLHHPSVQKRSPQYDSVEFFFPDSTMFFHHQTFIWGNMLFLFPRILSKFKKSVRTSYSSPWLFGHN